MDALARTLTCQSKQLPQPQVRSLAGCCVLPSCSVRHWPLLSWRQTEQKFKGSTYQYRYAHTRPRRHVSSSAFNIDATAGNITPPTSMIQVEMPKSPPPLSILPLPTLLLSYLTLRISSSPFLLPPSLKMLALVAHSKSPFLNPDTNRLLRFMLKNTLYRQFCAGESPIEVRSCMAELKTMGYNGVILAYAKEVVLGESDAKALNRDFDCREQADCTGREVSAWEKGTLDTVALTEKGDFVAVKFTGAGREALQDLSENRRPSERLQKVIMKICEVARDKGVRLLFDAEQAAVQGSINLWTIDFMRRYNRQGKALVYGTYQAYLKSTPETLARHLEEAKTDDFVLGVKLVRGAYLGSDPRQLIWSRIEETHAAYNDIAEALLRRKWCGILAGTGSFPEVNLVLASHNSESVRLAREVREEQCRRSEKRIDLVYGQLMGMADHVSCDLLSCSKERTQEAAKRPKKRGFEVPKALKYLVWGSVGECMKYLLRRAQENKDAVSRTVEARKALGAELKRRFGVSN